MSEDIWWLYGACVYWVLSKLWTNTCNTMRISPTKDWSEMMEALWGEREFNW